MIMDHKTNFKNQGVLNKEQIQREKQLKHQVEKKRWVIIEYLEKNPYSTIYGVSKGTKTNYSQMHQIMRELVFCRLVCLKPGYDSNGEPCELFFIPKKEETNG